MKLNYSFTSAAYKKNIDKLMAEGKSEQEATNIAGNIQKNAVEKKRLKMLKEYTEVEVRFIVGRDPLFLVPLESIHNSNIPVSEILPPNKVEILEFLSKLKQQ